MRMISIVAILLAWYGQAWAQTQASVTVNTAAVGAVVTNKIVGVNMANWFDQTQSGIPSALTASGIQAVRWPGGSSSDQFHWQTNSECNGGWASPNSTFDIFENTVAKPAGLDVAVTLNYGSNATCNGGGDPNEAAAWVAHAKANNEPVSHWTVGNEVYGPWEYDLHTPANDAATYAAAIATGYYPAIKAADRTAQVGIVVDPGVTPAWDPIVLQQAQYDFVEYHFYAQEPGQEDDTYLTTRAPQAFTAQITALQAELQAAGRGNTPIYVGELGSVYSSPGKQTSSITQALFAGQVLGEMMNAGVARATWWLGFGGCTDATGGNFSGSLYGWQNFGGYMMFSDGLPEWSCPGAPSIPLGTPLPTARVFSLFSLVAQTGQHALGVTLAGSSANLRAYALTQTYGYAVILFNLDPNNTLTTSLSIPGFNDTLGVRTTVYDRAIYDQSVNNVWAPPLQSAVSVAPMPLSLTLQPWSMTVVQLK